ncbi:MAG: ABC transporter permease [Pararhodobacter sp.]
MSTGLTTGATGARRRRGRYLLRRLGQSAIVLGIVLLLQFTLIHLAPGDIADVIAGDVQSDDPEFIIQLRRDLGLDQPLPIQFAFYVGRLLTLDLGTSHAFNMPVLTLILDRLPATLLLMFSAIALAFVAGAALGTIAAAFRGRWPDVLVTISALLFYATPVFLVGIGLILIFTVWLRWLPMSGMYVTWVQHTWWSLTVDIARHLIMPAVSLSLFFVAIYTRLMRATMLEVLSQDYVRTAWAKGLSPSRVVLRHAARNALLPMVTMLGLQVGSLLGGAVLVETVFGWPGIGRLAFEAVFRRDVPLVLGILFFSSVLVLMVNLLVDLLYTRLDPRIVLR